MKLVLYISALLLFCQCTTKQDLIIDRELNPRKIETSTYNILEHHLKGDILSLKIAYLGCKKDTFQLKANGMVLKSLPPQMPMVLIHSSNKSCTDSIKKTLKFNISPAQYPSSAKDKSVFLNIASYTQKIQYYYE